MNNSNKGLILQIPREVAEALRNGGGGRRSSGVEGAAGGGRRQRNNEVSTTLDSTWNELIPLSLSKQSKVASGERQNISDATITVPDVGDEDVEPDEQQHDQGDENDDNSDDDSISMSPPPSLPLVVINYEKLVGYHPSNEEQAIELQQQVYAALRGEVQQLESVEGEEKLDPEDLDVALGRNFDIQITKLMDQGIARHSDTVMIEGNEENDDDNSKKKNGKNSYESFSPYAIIEYPEFLYCKPAQQIASDPDGNDWVSTAKMWKRLLRPHNVEPVDRLFRRLRECHRSLLWKDALRRELDELVDSELGRLKREQYQHELQKWKQERYDRLQNLYAIRETIEYQLNVTSAKCQTMKKERDELVKLELAKRRCGLQNLDLQLGTIMEFSSPRDDDLWGALSGNRDDDDDIYDEYALMDDYALEHNDDNDDSYSDGYEGELEEGENDEGGDNTITIAEQHTYVGNPQDEAREVAESKVDDASNNLLQLQHPDSAATSILPSRNSHAAYQQKKKKKKMAKEKAKRRRERLQNAAQHAEHKARFDAAKAEEETFLDACTSFELKKTIAMEDLLQQRLDKVDELLESIQEEEWQDEEEQESNGEHQVDGINDSNMSSAVDSELSLLDEVLAMVLGATSSPNANFSDRDRAMWLATEHREIVQEWKEYFGRLPPSILLTKKKEMQQNDELVRSKVVPTNRVPGEAADESEKVNARDKFDGDRQQFLKDQFGIKDKNDLEDWEADEEDPRLGEKSQSQQMTKSSSKSPPKMGLRPGGCIQR